MEQNSYLFDHSALYSCKLHFTFDLFGSSIHSLAPNFCMSSSYRARRLADCPPLPALSVAVPPWNRLLALLSEVAADHANIKGRILLITPMWPAQPWWPLLIRLSQGKLVTFPGNPWMTRARKRVPHKAVGIWIGQ